jgi:hypothetical protein
MTEWIKKIWQIPFASGSQAINHVMSEILGSIINRCGKIFFDMETSESSCEIISSKQLSDDKLIYYFHDLPLKQRDQALSNSSNLRILSGIIKDCVLEIPWKNPLMEETIVRIGDFKIDIEITKTDPVLSHFTLSTSSTNLINESHNYDDLVSAYTEISIMVNQYFGRAHMTIDTLRIQIMGSVPGTLVLDGVKYQNKTLIVDNVAFKVKNHVEISARQIKYSLESHNLSIEYLEIRPGLHNYLLSFIQLLPIPKTSQINTLDENMTKDLIFSIWLGEIHYDGLIIFDARFTKDKILTIGKIEYQNNQIIEKFCIKNLFCPDESAILSNCIITVIDGKGLCNWFRNVVDKIQSLRPYFPPNNTSSSIPFSICLDSNDNSAYVKLIWEGTVSIFNFSRLTCESIDKIRFIQGDLVVHIKSIDWTDQIRIVNLHVKKNEMTYALGEELIVYTGKDTKLIVNGGKTEYLPQFIELCTNIIDNIKAYIDNDELIESSLIDGNSTNVELELHNSTIIHSFSQTFQEDEIMKIILDISKTNFSITHKLLNNLDAMVILSREIEGKTMVRKIATIVVSQLEESVIEIETLEILMDPILLDQICYCLGSLEQTPEWCSSEISEEGLAELQKALQRSTSESLDNFIKREKTIIQNSTLSKNKQIKSVYLQNLSRKIDDLQLSIIGLQPSSRSVRREFRIRSCQLLMYDELIETTNQSKSFIRASIKGIILITDKRKAPIIQHTGAIRIIAEPKKSKPKWIDQYHLKIDSIALIDQSCDNIDWKYMVSFAGQSIEMKIDVHGDSISLSIFLSPVSINLREETMIRLMAFVNNKIQIPKDEQPMMIENFEIKSNTITLSYYPMIADILPLNTLLSLRNHQINLNPRTYRYLDDFSQLFTLLRTDIINEINPANYCQFLPSLGLTKPCAEPISHIVSLWNCYLSSEGNRRKLRSLTRRLGKGIDFLSDFFQDKKLHGIINFFSS